jgi:uncharacterized heparinase superfamily protein
VGRFVGAEGVAYVAFAIRVAENLSFVRTAAGRLGVAALARLQHDQAKFQEALQRALQLQVLSLGPLLCGFALCGPWVVPRFLGERWLPAFQVYPFIAAGVLVNSVFNLQASALFVVGHQWAVVQAYASHVVLLAAATFFLLPQNGITGYGWAELLACAGYVFIYASVSKVAALSYRRLLPWMAVFLLPLVVQMLNVPFAPVLWLVLLGSFACVWYWLRASRVQREASNMLAKNPHVRHFITLVAKARTRGFRYVLAVLKFQFGSARYRLRHAGRRSLPKPSLIKADKAADLPSDGVFHFSANEIPQIVAGVPTELKQKAVIEADRVLQQHFCFRGREHVFVEHIDWNFCPDGNLSWHWDLNRHTFFLKLATAYYYSRNRMYLSRLLSLWAHWIANNPPGRGLTWQYPFEVAARLQNWMWAYFLAAYSGRLGKRQLQRLVLSIREHAEFVDAHLEHHWPNNHLLLEAKALYEFAILFPQSSGKYLKRARAVLEREVLAQVLPDGVHSELSSMYHRIVAGELGEFALLCRRQGKPLPDVVEGRIARMADFSLAALRHDGSLPLLGDSAARDSYLRFDLVQQDSDLNYWLWGDKAAPIFSRTESGHPELRIFPESGYVFMNRGHDANQVHLTFDAGPFSRCPTANHAHCDALSFELYADRRGLIVDPGFYFSWTDGSGWQRYFQSTGSHNTLKIDGEEQSELLGYTAVRRLARTHLVDQQCSQCESSATAECIPFWVKGEGIRHVREVRLSDHTVRIRDRVHGSGKHLLEWSFQFGPDIDVIPQGQASLVAHETDQYKSVLEMSVFAEPLPTLQLFCGSTNPLRGWISRESTAVLPAPQAVYSLHADLPFDIEFTLYLPGPGVQC